MKQHYLDKISAFGDSISAGYGFDLRSVGLFRLLLGVTLIVNWFMRARDAFVHYSNSGILPTSADLSFGFPDRLLIIIGDSHVLVGIFFALALIVYFMYTIGYKTYLFGVLSLFFVFAFEYRFFLGFHSGDAMLRMFLFWSLFLPISSRFSLDSLSKIKKGAQQAGASVLNPAVLAYMIQLSLIYYVAYMSKTGNVWTESNLALQQAFNTDYLTYPIGSFLLQFPGLLKLLTMATLYLEYILPFILLSFIYTKLLRYQAIIMIILLHVSILLTLRVGIFPVIGIVSVIPLIPSSFWESVSSRRIDSKLTTYIYAKTVTLRARSPRLLSSIGGRLHTALRPAVRPYIDVIAGASQSVALVISVSIFVFVASPYNGVIGGETYAAKIADNDLFYQKWDVFAPYPGVTERWYVFQATTSSGQDVDLWKHYWSEGQYYDLSFDKPDSPTDTYINSYWQKFIENLSRPEVEGRIYDLASLACSDWNNSRQDQVVDGSLNVYAVFETVEISDKYTKNHYTKDLVSRNLQCKA